MVKNKLLITFMLSIFILLSNFTLLADEEIDPYQYSVVLGWAEELEGEVVLTKKSGETIKIKNKQAISSEKIRIFTLIYNDNAITLTDGRKDIEDLITLKTGANGSLKLRLNDLQNNESYLLINNDTEISISIRGGCIYTTEMDGEGYDSNTLKWRHINPYTNIKVHSGKVRVYYRPNGKLSLGDTSTENGEIRVNQSRIKNYIDYEVQVLRGEDAKEIEVNSSDIYSAEMNDTIQGLIDGYLELYQVENIEELDSDIKETLMMQLEVVQQSYQEINESVAEMEESGLWDDVVGNLVTILKVYKGEASLEDTLVTDRELSIINGNIGRASTPEKF
ncbi:MAG: hypothetical protein ACOCRO_05045 [Halanaerobiales bacterium]